MRAFILSILLLCVQHERIDDLISQLAADSYQTREAATIELVEIGKPAIAQVKKAIKETPDPEVRARCKMIVWAYYDVRDSDGDLPYIWQVNDEVKAEMSKCHEGGPLHYWNKAKKTLSYNNAVNCGLTWSQYHDGMNVIATKMMIADLLDNFEYSREDVRKLLDKMSVLPSIQTEY